MEHSELDGSFAREIESRWSSIERLSNRAVYMLPSPEQVQRLNYRQGLAACLLTWGHLYCARALEDVAHGVRTPRADGRAKNGCRPRALNQIAA